MGKKKSGKSMTASMTSTMAATGKYAFRPHVILPAMLGLLSVLAVFTATGHSQSPYAFTTVHLCWLLAGICMLSVTIYPIDEHVRWATITGAIALAIVYVSVFVPGVSASGRPGSIQVDASGQVVFIPAVLFSPIYLLWLVRYLPIAKHGGDVSWRRFGIFLCQCMVWWLPYMVIPRKELLVAAVVTFSLLYWIEGGHWSKALAGPAVAAAGLGILLASIKWLPNAYYSAQRVKDQWVVSMTLSQTSYFNVAETAVRAQETLPTGNGNAIFLSMIESVGFVGAGFFVLVASVVGCYAVRHAIRSGTSIPTTVTITAWIWISVRALVYIVSLLGVFPGIDVPCPIFNADGNDLIATMIIVSAGLHRGRSTDTPVQSSAAGK